MRVKIRTAGTCSYHVLLGRFRLHLCGLNGFFFAGSIRSFEPEKKTGKKHEALHSYIRGGGLSVLRDACAELF